jgi:hypothetical protein
MAIGYFFIRVISGYKWLLVVFFIKAISGY